MSISFEYKKRQVEYHYREEDFKKTQELADHLKKELGDLLRGVVLFGSAVRGTNAQASDVDVLLIVDDLTIVFSQEVITSLRVIIENTASSIANNFHITTFKLSEFWEYARQGDPIIVNMLREGKTVFDAGFFQPLQTLLDDGKIRPTKEAVWAYYLRAPKTIKSAQEKILQAIVELYWGVMDASHAALMHVDVVPGAPHEVASLLEKHFVQKHLLEKDFTKTLKMFYKLAKGIGHHQLVDISGNDLDRYIEMAQDYVKRMKFIISHNPEKLKELKEMDD